jgi:hypothetical protein
MDKLSTADVSEVLAEVPVVIRSLVEENKDLREKVAAANRKDHAERVATLMEDKGHQPDVGFRAKVAHLLEDPNRDLRVMEEAVRMETPAVKLASVSEGPGHGSDPLTSYLMEGV